MFNLLFNGVDISKILEVTRDLFPNLPNLIAHIIATVIILIFITKKIYKPFKKFNENQAIEINKLLEEAKNKEIETSKFNLDAKINMETARSKAQEIINEANLSAEERKSSELERTKREISLLHEIAEKNMAIEKDKMMDEFELEVLRVSFEATKKILANKITKEENDKLVKQFIDGIK